MKTEAMMDMWDRMHPEESEDEYGTYWDTLVWKNHDMLYMSPKLVI